ncbi:hypothetical protein [Planococcus shenhongbingii]|uniref:Uncharacterized protein n=1 Tax=Planococcus shenhongbingii TaxID=3058398 RepID=A0ABT8NI07_9BACL|nr:hypothetical protein [Planococcus sp. N017]MDN7247085.1 hypothetical protein [Planococcus sp. N017]
MSRMELIYLYGEGVTNLETSPFGMLGTFQMIQLAASSAFTKRREKDASWL